MSYAKPVEHSTNHLSRDQKISGQEKLRVMVVDDSVVVRGLVSKWVEDDPDLELAGKAANGKKAVEMSEYLKPDVIILDIEMPVMTGLQALPKLLQNCPQAKVLMASTLTQRNAEISLKALSLGAADYVPKPERNSNISTSQAFRRELFEKIKVLGRSHNRIVSPLRPVFKVEQNKSKSSITAPVNPAADFPAFAPKGIENNQAYQLRSFSMICPKVLVIGSSTGGPPALISMMKAMSAIVERVPVLITQHMPATFTTIFAKHLGDACGMASAEAIDGEAVIPGRIYVAPGGKHMVVEKTGSTIVTRLMDGPEVNYCKPAVDPLFETVAQVYGASSLALVLTGMGSDGGKGAKVIADAGGSVIAQDEESSVVWGMPGAAAKMNACSAILPLSDIVPKLNKLILGR